VYRWSRRLKGGHGRATRDRDTGTVSGDPGNDATVIARSLDDPEQFAVVFRRHAPDIHRYVVRRLGPGAADDVVAETFLTAFRLRSRYSHDRPDARPWLYGIATNLVGRHRRADGQAVPGAGPHRG
jgi:RNA polymerase sigma-70 factor (ECF subfamily)